MQIFSSHRRKLEPKRRFGSLAFRKKVSEAASYKRSVSIPLSKMRISKFWRYLGAFLVVIAAYYLWLSPKFVLSNFEISGNSQISTQQIIDAIGKHRFFFLSQGRANKILTSSLPLIKEIKSYARVWPDRVKIEIVERVPGFVIRSNDKYFLVDEEGTVISQVPDSQNKLLVEDQLTEDFAIGETLPDSKMAAFVLSMSKQWASKISTPIASVKFPGKQSSEVQFVTSEGWTVFFDINRPVVAQLNDLAVLLNKQIGGNRGKLAYIDLRLAKWAYYCFKATPCSQVPQEEPKP